MIERPSDAELDMLETHYKQYEERIREYFKIQKARIKEAFQEHKFYVAVDAIGLNQFQELCDMAHKDFRFVPHSFSKLLKECGEHMYTILLKRAV